MTKLINHLTEKPDPSDTHRPFSNSKLQPKRICETQGYNYDPQRSARLLFSNQCHSFIILFESSRVIVPVCVSSLSNPVFLYGTSQKRIAV